MKDTRTEDHDWDPRKNSDVVHVKNYKKSVGTTVEKHTRKKPVATGKLKFRLTDQDIRLKGKISTFDQDGRKTDTQRINAREKLTPEESRKIRQLQGSE